MVYKRPFADEEDYRVGFKHPRHLEYCNHLTSFVDIAPCIDSPEDSHTSGEMSFIKRHVSEIIFELPVGGHMEFESGATCSLSSSWVTDSDSEKDSRSEASVQPDEICSPHLDYGSRKLVSIGPNHQADIPVWGPKDSINASGHLKASDPRSGFPQRPYSELSIDEKSEEKLMGSCVIPMPNADILAYNNNYVEHGVDDCSCPDTGSVRCVRMHIMESRDRLRATLGHKTFVELGFHEMGEVVARNWSEQEELVFHEVVFSNSASSGRNFWHHLSAIFPSRTKKELVSYYFNVFMLRRRAEQNRLNSLNIDSDNDEWEGSEEEEDDELRTVDEDGNSAVESPQESPIYYEKCEEHSSEDNEGGDYDDGDVQGDGYVAGEVDYCSFGPDVQISYKNEQNSGVDNDAQDDSCMSFECRENKADLCSQSDVVTVTKQSEVEDNHGEEHLQCHFDDRLNNCTVEHGYVLGFWDSKVWDAGYLGGFNEDVDFLPTCNMIEQVFGDEAWNNNKGSSDGKSISLSK